MRTGHLGSLAVAALVASAAAAPAAPQATSPILNALEVRTLVSSLEPGDHARLGVHFAALAERYARDARRHTAMAQAFVASPARRTGVNSAADHCRRLAQLNTESAATLRELAAHHEKLAAGEPSTTPRGAARFQGGAGAPEPTAEELSALAAKASAPRDHLALEEYFLTAAKRYTAAASEHVAMASAYRGGRIAQAAVHCDRLVALARDSAKEATEAAGTHRQLAGIAR
jgi:hypothetical protein